MTHSSLLTLPLMSYNILHSCRIPVAFLAAPFPLPSHAARAAGSTIPIPIVVCGMAYILKLYYGRGAYTLYSDQYAKSEYASCEVITTSLSSPWPSRTMRAFGRVCLLLAAIIAGRPITNT